MKRLQVSYMCPGFGLVKACALLCFIQMSEILLFCLLLVACILCPRKNLKDCLVEVIGLVSENVMACSPDDLKKYKTHS